MIDEPDINKLLMRSAELGEALAELYLVKPGVDSNRMVSSKVMSSVVLEHAESIQMLIAGGNCTSAFSLFRLQYEVLVRAIWLLYAASEKWIATLMTEATQERADKANKLPLLSEMLAELEGKAPKPAMDMLYEFKEVSWKPLCSFVHGGFHALHRHGGGYPLPLIVQVLKASNGLSTMAGMHLVILACDSTLTGRIPEIQNSFWDCLPLPKPNTP